VSTKTTERGAKVEQTDSRYYGVDDVDHPVKTALLGRGEGKIRAVAVVGAQVGEDALGG